MKRRNETKVSETKSKSSKVETNKPKKPLTKDELLVKFKALEEKHNKLLEENVKHVETISILQNKVNFLDRSVKNAEIFTQTDYIAEQVKHSEDGYTPFLCGFCEEVFHTKGDIMKHKKEKHTAEVDICWKFATMKCIYGNEKCWFIHDEVKQATEFNCKLCEKSFVNLHELMKHKKIIHMRKVQVCKNINNGRCMYGKQNCWFKHEETETEINESIAQHNDKDEKVNNEDIQRMLKMMETLTERIVTMEMTNNMKSK